MPPATKTIKRCLSSRAAEVVRGALCHEGFELRSEVVGGGERREVGACVLRGESFT